MLFLQFQPPIPVFGIEGRYATAFYSAAMKEKKIDAVEAELVSLKVCIGANHYDFSVIVTNFRPKLRCYGQQSTCYGFPIIAGPEPFPI